MNNNDLNYLTIYTNILSQNMQYLGINPSNLIVTVDNLEADIIWDGVFLDNVSTEVICL